jgi:hypothetical protein
MVVWARPVVGSADAESGSVSMTRHHLPSPAEGADRHAAADALGQAEQVGLDAEPLVAPP